VFSPSVCAGYGSCYHSRPREPRPARRRAFGRGNTWSAAAKSQQIHAS
jgi:hypothetical protein